MLVRFPIFIVLLFGLLGDGGSEAGRRGNVLFRQGEYAEAEAAYRRGLRVHEDTTDAVYAALQTNLGAALHRQEKFAAARTAFTRALRAAKTDAARTRALYNAGNAAVGQDRLDDALRFYRRVLRTDPTHEAARFNYEYVKRERDRRNPNSRQPEPEVEPSPYAVRLKQQADRLVSRRQYDAALALLQEGLQQDSTLRAYRAFTRRLEDVAQIQRTGGSAPRSLDVQ